MVLIIKLKYQLYFDVIFSSLGSFLSVIGLLFIVISIGLVVCKVWHSTEGLPLMQFDTLLSLLMRCFVLRVHADNLL